MLPERSGRALDPRSKKRSSQKTVGDWILGRRADGLWPWKWFPRRLLPKLQDFWDPWQLRRNWIYRQYESDQTRAADRDPFLSISRHEIWEEDYRPQPFEQAIRVARAEGREDFATQFEMHKKRLEWRLFNLRVRWGLGGIAITLAALWLIIHSDSWLSDVATFVAWLGTVALMIFGTWVREKLRTVLKTVAGLSDNASDTASKAVVRIAYWLPASLLLVSLWWDTPWNWIAALAIFASVRLLGVLAHGVMRFGFGYLRRPINAVVTLIGAFLIGWLGVSTAESRDMFVVAADPVAGWVGPWSAAAAPDEAGHDPPIVMGSERPTAADTFVRDISCSHEISKPLYALDVLVPIVDLGEESRCEIRRFPAPGRPVADPEPRNLLESAFAVLDGPLNHHRFWWWMKAIYAVAGWLIVSLAILTFAQVNRTEAEPPSEQQ